MLVPILSAIALLALPARSSIPCTGRPAAPPLGAHPAPAGGFDYEGCAREYLEELDYQGTADGLLDGPAFAALRLGSFDLRVPRASLEDKKYADMVADTVKDQLEMQVQWGRWSLRDAEQRAALEEDAKVLSKWIGRWSGSKLRSAAGKKEPLAEAMGAKDDVLAALERTATALTAMLPARLGGGPNPARIVLAPERKAYVQLLCALPYLGLGDPGRVWKDASLFGTNAWVGSTMILPFEFPRDPPRVETALEGWAVEKFIVSSLRVHAAERSASALLTAHFAWNTDPLVETALAKNLVIATIGETRLVNDFTYFQFYRPGASTAPYSRFVPGGNPAGGTLPPRKAVAGPTQVTVGGEVHEKKIGHKFFLELLRDKQKEGAKLAAKDRDMDVSLRKEEDIHFALEGNRAQEERMVVSAPFLGDRAAGKPLPDAVFLDSYEDFFATYRSSFLEWLRTQESEDSEERFRELIARLVELPSGGSLDGIVKDVYGTTVGWAPDEPDGLEARFLEYLAKGK